MSTDREGAERPHADRPRPPRRHERRRVYPDLATPVNPPPVPAASWPGWTDRMRYGLGDPLPLFDRLGGGS